MKKALNHYAKSANTNEFTELGWAYDSGDFFLSHKKFLQIPCRQYAVLWISPLRSERGHSKAILWLLWSNERIQVFRMCTHKWDALLKNYQVRHTSAHFCVQNHCTNIVLIRRWDARRMSIIPSSPLYCIYSMSNYVPYCCSESGNLHFRHLPCTC